MNDGIFLMNTSEFLCNTNIRTLSEKFGSIGSFGTFHFW